MKMAKEHYEHMREAMRPLADQIAARREAVIAEGKAKDVDKRVRWDWWRSAGLLSFTADTLYGYLDDTHIDTALRAISKELGAR